MIFFTILFWGIVFLAILIVCFCIFFDQAIFNRKGTVYYVKTNKKQIALTFDDGPSPIWTPKILQELRQANIPATFFMVGAHVKKYSEVARQVAEEGHLIANHGYAHRVLLYYTPKEIEEEIKYTEYIIRETTGQTTRFFRPPKAWLRKKIKEKICEMGYDIVLWSLNSKDWVTFNHRYIVNRLVRQVKNGDILLFHDSGGVFTKEGGDRSQTVAAISLLTQRLLTQNFEFVTVDKLIYGEGINRE